MEERSERATWQRYGVAIALVLLASLLTLVLSPRLTIPPFAPFYGAVALTAWYGGLGPALLATALSLLGISLFALEPIRGWSTSPDDLIRLFSFLAVSALLAGLSASRDRAEHALRASERRFRTMLETANEGVWLIDREARTQYANDRMAALLGTTPERVMAGSVADFVHAEDVALLRERVGNNLAGRAEEFDFRFRRADGGEVLVRAGTSPVRDGSGRVMGALGLFTDITARRQAENALRLLSEAGSALATSLDYEETVQWVAWLAVPALADWCVVDLRDQDGAIRRVAIAYADPEHADLAARAMHVPPSAAVAGPVMQVMQSGIARLIETIDEGMYAGAAQSAEHGAIMRAIGATSVIIAPLPAGGKIHGTISLMTTASSNRRFDQDDLAIAMQLASRAAMAIESARRLRDAQTAEVRYRGLFEGTKDGIIVFGPDGQCVDVNPAMAGMAGYSRTELVGFPASLVACGGPWSGEDDDLLRRDGQWRGDFELRHKDGSLVPVESSITTVQLPTGPVYVGVLRDISERKRFEQLQEEFLSSLAHDLKNPLTTVLGQTQLLMRRIGRGESPEPARLESALEGIDTAARRMARLLDEMTDITRLRAGQEIDLHRAETDLVALARWTIEEHDRNAVRHAIRLVSDLDELRGYWDGPRLERVLGNLLGNAIKYSPRGGEITVRIAREDHDEGDTAVLSVEDRGVGIPSGDRALIFERFRRAANVTRFAGSGIGLAGAKRIVELHGGTIAVTSTENQGSTFTVRIPVTRKGQ
ncbi:MAG: PAS domain S-box protein [Chloroflexota bacterium]|nr:PAS domain S-box protein [Chloroflexota bacterium]